MRCYALCIVRGGPNRESAMRRKEPWQREPFGVLETVIGAVLFTGLMAAFGLLD